MALVLALLNIIIVVYGTWWCVRTRSLGVFFWISSGYVLGFPLLLDSLFIMVGHADYVADLYYGFDGLAVSIDNRVLARASAYSMFFNLTLFLSQRFFRSRFQWHRKRFHGWYNVSATTLLYIILTIGGNLALVYEVFVEYGGPIETFHKSFEFFAFGPEYGFSSKIPILHKVSKFLIYSSCSAVYYGLRTRSIGYILFAGWPALAMALITSQRPYGVALIGTVIYYYLGQFMHMYSARRSMVITVRSQVAPLEHRFISKRTQYTRRGRLPLVLLFALGFTSIFALNFVRVQKTYPESLRQVIRRSFDQTVLMRDISTGTGYWVFRQIPNFHSSTGGRSSLAILTTLLHIPRSVDEQEDSVVHYVAAKRNSWFRGSVHPTIYGWTYCDLLWMGILWGVVLGGGLAFADAWVCRSEIRASIAVPAVSVGTMVSVRGSLHYGVIEGVYGFIVAISIATFVIYLASFRFSRSKSRRSARLVMSNTSATR